MGDNIQVAVRLRPFSKREVSLNGKLCVRIEDETRQTIITNPSGGKEEMFSFDYNCKSVLLVVRRDSGLERRENHHM